MNIEELTTAVKTLQSLFSGPNCNSNVARGELGQNIIVMDRGFVYVGDVTEEQDRLIIKNAKNLRIWGTTEGLGELRNGPISGKTKVDQVGDVCVYRHAVIHLIKCKGF